VQVPYDEGVANRIDPKSCAGFREGVCEAFQGSAQAKLLNRENDGRRRFACCGRQYGRARQRKCPPAPAWSENFGMCGRSLYGNREISRSTKSDITRAAVVRIGRRSDFK
jgi:hypothetical protein